MDSAENKSAEIVGRDYRQGDLLLTQSQAITEAKFVCHEHADYGHAVTLFYAKSHHFLNTAGYRS